MYIIKLKYNFFVIYKDKMNSYDIATKNLIYSQDQIIPYNIGFMPFS